MLRVGRLVEKGGIICVKALEDIAHQGLANEFTAIANSVAVAVFL